MKQRKKTKRLHILKICTSCICITSAAIAASGVLRVAATSSAPMELDRAFPFLHPFAESLRHLVERSLQ